MSLCANSIILPNIGDIETYLRMLENRIETKECCNVGNLDITYLETKIQEQENVINLLQIQLINSLQREIKSKLEIAKDLKIAKFGIPITLNQTDNVYNNYFTFLTYYGLNSNNKVIMYCFKYYPTDNGYKTRKWYITGVLDDGSSDNIVQTSGYLLINSIVMSNPLSEKYYWDINGIIYVEEENNQESINYPFSLTLEGNSEDQLDNGYAQVKNIFFNGISFSTLYKSGLKVYPYLNNSTEWTQLITYPSNNIYNFFKFIWNPLENTFDLYILYCNIGESVKSNIDQINGYGYEINVYKGGLVQDFYKELDMNGNVAGLIGDIYYNISNEIIQLKLSLKINSNTITNMMINKKLLNPGFTNLTWTNGQKNGAISPPSGWYNINA